MAWSDAARAASIEARRRRKNVLFSKPQNYLNTQLISRKAMALKLRKARQDTRFFATVKVVLHRRASPLSSAIQRNRAALTRAISAAGATGLYTSGKN